VFCLPHRMSLVLAAEGFPVYWESIRLNRTSGSCPICRAGKLGNKELDKAIDKWVAAARMNPNILSENVKDSSNSSDKDNSMDFKEQQKNKEKLRAENNRRIVSQLTQGSIPSNNRRLNKPNKKPNHLRLV